MSKHGSEPRLWTPRHSGWTLAHHLLPSFVLFAFVSATGTYALLHGRPVLSTALFASALAVLMGIVSALRRPTVDQPAQEAAVATSTGTRAATWFPMVRTSGAWAAAVMGLAVVILVASIALSARLLFIHSYDPLLLILLLAVLLIMGGVYVLNRGIHMARVAATAQEPGVYLTRSRILLYGSRGIQEIYWNDVTGITEADPPRRRPLGKRGPAWIVLSQSLEQPGTPGKLMIPVHELSANPDQLKRTIEHYWVNANQRLELGTETALLRVEGFMPLD